MMLRTTLAAATLSLLGLSACAGTPTPTPTPTPPQPTPTTAAPSFQGPTVPAKYCNDVAGFQTLTLVVPGGSATYDGATFTSSQVVNNHYQEFVRVSVTNLAAAPRIFVAGAIIDWTAGTEPTGDTPVIIDSTLSDAGGTLDQDGVFMAIDRRTSRLPNEAISQIRLCVMPSIAATPGSGATTA